jgi:hypothetical protein
VSACDDVAVGAVADGFGSGGFHGEMLSRGRW